MAKVSKQHLEMTCVTYTWKIKDTKSWESPFLF